MRSPILAMFFASLATFVLAAPAHSAAVLDIVEEEDVDIRNEKGVLLTVLELNKEVVLFAVVTNTGDANFTGFVTVVFTILDEDDNPVAPSPFEQNKTLTALESGEQEEFTQEWVPKKLGTYRLVVGIENQPASEITVHFSVKSKEVPRGSLYDFATRYAWFYGGFVAVLALYFAVLRVRKPRQE